MDEVIKFLKERGVDEKILAEMEREKVSDIVITFPITRVLESSGIASPLAARGGCNICRL